MKKGNYVIVRSNMAGVLCGTLESKTGTEVVLTDARKIYSWRGANTVEDIAIKGVDAENSRITVSVAEIVIDDVCQVLVATKEAEKVIKGAETWTA